MTARPAPVPEQQEPADPASSVSTSAPSGVSMDVLSLLRLVGRHWRVTAPALLLTLIGLVAALQLSSPTYQATGSIVLLSPPEAPDVNAPPGSAPAPEVGQNPFARYGDLSIVADILARVMDSDSMRAEIEAKGISGYEVLANSESRGPVIEVVGEEPTPDAAIRSAESVLGEVDATLIELQKAEGADPDYFISSAPLEPASTATAMYGSTVRAAIAALAVGLLCTLALAVLAEAVVQRRPARPTTAAGPPVPGGVTPNGDRVAANGSHAERGVADHAKELPDLRLARRGLSQRKPAPRDTRERKSAPRDTTERKPAPRDTVERQPAPGDTTQRKAPPRDTVQWKPASPDTTPPNRSSDSQRGSRPTPPATDRSP
jgi:hypothetical protein